MPRIQPRGDAVTATALQAIPANAEDCAELLVRASRERRTVRIAGGSTKSYLGDARETDIELGTMAIAGIVDHVPADLTITVRGGSPLADVASALAVAGQFLPLDPPHGERATVGGVIAANANGFWRARYGGVRDLLIGTRTALADGSVVRSGGRVVKNVAGYDLNKLLVGSLGTLGVIVEATFKVLPLPAARDGRLGRFENAADAFAAADAILRAPARAESIAIARRDGAWILLVEARGDAPAVGRCVADAEREVRSRGGSTDAFAGGLRDLRELPERATDGALVRLALPLAAQARLAETAVSLDTFRELAADAASGIQRMHLVGEDDRVVADADALLLAARAAGGSGRVERRAQRLRARLATWSARPHGEVLMRRVKDAFDPAGILEPGRSVLAP